MGLASLHCTDCRIILFATALLSWTWLNITTINQNPVVPIINVTLYYIGENEYPQKFRAILLTVNDELVLDDTVPSENVYTPILTP